MIKLSTEDLEKMSAKIKALETEISQEFGFSVRLAITQAADIKTTPRKALLRIFINRTKEAVCAEYGITIKQLQSPARDGGLPKYRYICYKLIKDAYPDTPTGYIGKLFGGRDHSTVIAGLKQFNELAERDSDYWLQYHKLKDKIRNGKQRLEIADHS